MTSDASPAAPNPALDAALAYAARGWRVVPIIPGQKRPPLGQWTEVATSDATKITAWWGDRYADHGVGIVCGWTADRSSCLFVLDVDEGHQDGVSGGDTLAELEAAHGALPATMEVVTGNGGRHLYFTADVEIRNDAGRRLGPGLDVRGEGGQVLAPPTYHPNGTRYEYEASSPTEPAAAPPWLLDLLTADDTPQTPTTPVVRLDDAGDRPGDRWAAQMTWAQLLEADGWTLHHVDRDGEEHWTRPGKERRDGTSATVGYKGSDVLKVFTSSVPELAPEATYTKLGYLAATRHHGDHSAAARALAADGWGSTPGGLDALLPPPGAGGGAVELAEPSSGSRWAAAMEPSRVDFSAAWWASETGADWLLEPIIPARRQTAIVSGPKVGKSLLILDAAVALATGRAFLDEPAKDPVGVMYLDLEMTEDDLRERMVDLGYGPDDDLSHLTYYSLPSLPPLDTPDGGAAVAELAAFHDVALVIVDTTSRVISGEENSADTFAALYRHTGLLLKAAGRALVRLDHTGHEHADRARGSSAKAADIDLIWSLSKTDGGVRLKRTHQRISWAPEYVELRRSESPLRHELTDDGWPEGTQEVADLLDGLQVPLTATANEALCALRDVGRGRRKELVVKAQKWRRRQAGTAAGTALDEFLGTAAGTAASKVQKTQQNRAGTAAGTAGTAEAERVGTGGGFFQGTPRSRSTSSRPEPII